MIKIGIIGASPLLKTHAAYLKTSKKIEVVGLMNTGERDLETSFFPETPKPVTNVEQLIHESDCIFITGSCQEYFDVAVMALKNSRHLFLNDLSGLPVNQAMRLTKLASEADSVIYPSQLLRFNKAALKASQHLSKPLFIDLEHRQTRCSSWNNTRSLHGALMEEISLILSFVSSGVKKVNTATAKIYGDFPELIDARLEFTNGCVATLKMNCLTTEDKHQLTIFQEGKLIEVNLEHPSFSIFSQKERNKIVEEKETDLPDMMDEGSHELDYFLDLADSKQKIRIDNEKDLQAFFITDEIMSRLQRNGIT